MVLPGSLNACCLTVKCCKILASSIISSHLRELDLGNNNLTDEGLLLLLDSLKKSKIETLRSVVNIIKINKNPRLKFSLILQTPGFTI